MHGYICTYIYLIFIIFNCLSVIPICVSLVQWFPDSTPWTKSNSTSWKHAANEILGLNLKSGLPWWLSGKESAWQCRRCRFDLWVEKIPWRRAWQRTPVLLRGESPWTEEPCRLQSMGLSRVRHDWAFKQRLPQIYWTRNLRMDPTVFASVRLSCDS